VVLRVGHGPSSSSGAPAGSQRDFAVTVALTFSKIFRIARKPTRSEVSVRPSPAMSGRAYHPIVRHREGQSSIFTSGRAVWLSDDLRAAIEVRDLVP